MASSGGREGRPLSRSGSMLSWIGGPNTEACDILSSGGEGISTGKVRYGGNVNINPLAAADGWMAVLGKRCVERYWTVGCIVRALGYIWVRHHPHLS